MFEQRQKQKSSPQQKAGESEEVQPKDKILPKTPTPPNSKEVKRVGELDISKNWMKNTKELKPINEPAAKGPLIDGKNRDKSIQEEIIESTVNINSPWGESGKGFPIVTNAKREPSKNKNTEQGMNF